MLRFKNTIFLALLLFCTSRIFAQQNFSLYHMESLPQRQSLNPALLPDSKWFLGFPAASSFGLQVTNTGFNLNAVNNALFLKNADTSVLNLNKLLDVFSKQNYVSVKADQTWLNFGFKYKKHFFSANITEKASIKLGYPKDLFRFIIDGNGGPNLGETFDFRFSADAMHYREHGIGYAFSPTQKLTLGAKVNFLKGLSLIELKEASLKVRTRPEDYAYEISSNLELNTASSLGPIIDANGSLSNPDVRKLFTGIRNNGIGLNLGASYVATPKINLSVGLNDLGYINWKQNARSIVSSNPSATFVFDGIPIQSNDSQFVPEKYFSQLADSLLNLFGVDTVNRTFRSSLSTELFVGVNYRLAENLKLNALFYGDVYNRRFYGGLTLGLYWRPVKIFSINLTNTFYGRAWLNPGFAAAINAGPVQGYLVAENFLAPLMPGIARGAALRMGINLTFGRMSSRTNTKGSGKQGDAAPIDPTSIH